MTSQLFTMMTPGATCITSRRKARVPIYSPVNGKAVIRSFKNGEKIAGIFQFVIDSCSALAKAQVSR